MFSSHLGFAVFMLLLLVAPQIPIIIPGGITESNISLGLVGLVIWFLLYCNRNFPSVQILRCGFRISHPLFWLIIFALYAFLISLISASIVSIAYGIQFLFYSIVLGFLMLQYSDSFSALHRSAAEKIVMSIGALFSIAIIVSAFTGPIYPHQTRWTLRNWGGAVIQQGVGFSESQNLAGPVVVFFLAFCIFMYSGKLWKKWCLLVLMFYALMTTLSRAIIISFIIALALVYGMDIIKSFFSKMKIRQLSKQISFCMSGILVSLAFFILVNTFVYKSFIPALRTGLGIENKKSHDSQRIASPTGLCIENKKSHDPQRIALRDLNRRLDNWKHGIDYWRSQSLIGKIFGRGFRASMDISPDTKSWYCAHNVYINIIGDFGVIGLVIFLIMILKAFRDFIYLSFTRGSEHIGKFGLLVLVVLSIDNLTGPYFYSPLCLSLLIISFSLICFRTDARFMKDDFHVFI